MKLNIWFLYLVTKGTIIRVNIPVTKFAHIDLFYLAAGSSPVNYSSMLTWVEVKVKGVWVTWIFGVTGQFFWRFNRFGIDSDAFFL
jgi:hypothetical protein